VLDLLTRLVDKSLVDVMHDHGETRFRMLETIREYLHRQLVASGELVDVRRRHLDSYVDLAEGLAPRLPFGGGPVHLARLEIEHANLDEALEWAASSGQRDALLRLATALTLLWELRGHLAYGSDWFARGLDDEALTPSTTNARALWGAAHVAFYGNDWDLALRRSAEALAMAETIGDQWATARALNTVGVLQATSEPAPARVSLTRSIELAQRTGDLWAVADGWKMIAVTKVIEHDDIGAFGPLDELRRVAERLDSKFFLGWYHAEVGYFARDRGDFADARIALEASVRCCELVGDPSTGGFAQTWLAALEADTGDITGGIRRVDQVLAHASATGSDLAAPEALYVRGGLALGQGDPNTALALTTDFIETSRDAGLATWVAQALVVAAHAHRLRGDLAAATRAVDEATTLAEPFNSTFLECLINHERANILRADDRANAAEDLLLSVLTRQINADLRPAAIQTLETLASCALTAESPADATRCFAAAQALREVIGYVPTPVEQATIETERATCRDILGDAEFESNHEIAGTLSLDEIAAWLSRARGRRHRPSSGWGSLTPTELQVSTLVAEGLTNPQIAQRMFIATGTAKIHVSHIFNKLGLTTRAQLATEVTSHRPR
jgi:DNA-binding NarL/FixJ family response regulator